MKIGEYRKETSDTLAGLFGEEAKPLCDILLCSFLDIDKSELILRENDEIPRDTVLQMDEAVNELGFGVPVQYIMGNCWFFGRKISIGRGCFIPRSDTETLAQTAASCLPAGGSFADICAGSGCISAAVAEIRKDATGFALELSYKALKYTEKNLEGFSNVTVKRFDALDEDDYYALLGDNGGKFDVIVCNPPYIRSGDINLLQQQVQYEPLDALDGGEDGLHYYREITKLASIILKENGALLYELGYDQAGDVASILREKGYQTAVIKDLNGIERVILGKKY
ncbi:MAG: peptide chain release factor N(5)-glutamine methyltransferase [Victivallales bacterium]